MTIKKLLSQDWVVSSYGEQVYLKDGGLLANCSSQWADNDDEYGRRKDDERGAQMAKAITQLPAAYKLLRYLDRRGGLGLEVHNNISMILRNMEGDED